MEPDGKPLEMLGIWKWLHDRWKIEKGNILFNNNIIHSRFLLSDS